MKKKINVLVFPCGSEIGLEIHRSLRFSNHITLFGGSSVDDHGKFVYENYISNMPFVNHTGFIDSLKDIIDKFKIDVIYPAMDEVVTEISKHADSLGCNVVASDYETTKVCLSKTKTYQALANHIQVPKIYENLNSVDKFPVFMKPDVGYGSRGAKKIHSKSEANQQLAHYPNSIITEYLPGNEFTVDCFTNYKGELLFYGARQRKRIMNGISVNTQPVKENNQEFENLALKINTSIKLRGAWFFQVKEDENGNLILLEVASRLGGSSGIFRNLGVNFALLSVFDQMQMDVEVFSNNYKIELDRALDCKFKLEISYKAIYVDFDDCILISDKLNTELLSFLFKSLNQNKKIILITKHDKDIHDTLKKLRIESLFDKIIHLKKTDLKSEFILEKDSIFIDDSFEERKDVYNNLKIPVFAPDAVQSLI